MPNPGSDEARKQGCTCPVLDNNFGKGQYGNGEEYGWVIVGGCPLHDEPTEIVGVSDDVN